MRFNEFVKRLEQAGWRGSCDAQHSGIKKMWEELFPVVAELEKELQDAEQEFLTHIEI